MGSLGADVIPFEPCQYRAERAKREADRRDRVWFRNRSDRLWRARPLIPHELILADGEERNVVLVYRNFVAGCVERIAITTQTELPDDDNFLGTLWMYILQNKEPGKMLDISPMEHLAMLQMSGHEHGGAA